MGASGGSTETTVKSSGLSLQLKAINTTPGKGQGNRLCRPLLLADTTLEYQHRHQRSHQHSPYPVSSTRHATPHQRRCLTHADALRQPKRLHVLRCLGTAHSLLSPAPCLVLQPSACVVPPEEGGRDRSGLLPRGPASGCGHTQPKVIHGISLCGAHRRRPGGTVGPRAAPVAAARVLPARPSDWRQRFAGGLCSGCAERRPHTGCWLLACGSTTLACDGKRAAWLHAAAGPELSSQGGQWPPPPLASRTCARRGGRRAGVWGRSVHMAEIKRPVRPVRPSALRAQQTFVTNGAPYHDSDADDDLEVRPCARRWWLLARPPGPSVPVLCALSIPLHLAPYRTGPPRAPLAG